MSASGLEKEPMLTQHSSDPQSPSFDWRKDANPGLPSGDQSAVEPPGPIPNPEVKRRSADGSETIGLVRVGRRQVFVPVSRKIDGDSSFIPYCRVNRETRREVTNGVMRESLRLADWT
jgi:hypothetical protein